MAEISRTLVFQTNLADGTLEKINATFDYCKDYTGDGLHDIKVTFSVADESYSGTEDLLGVAFDVANFPGGLKVVQIDNGAVDDSSIDELVSNNGVNNSTFPGLNMSGGPINNLVPFDVGVIFSDGGEGTDGATRTGSFVLSADTALDAGILLDNSDFYIRLQSTNEGPTGNGGGSAKMGGHVNDGDLPECPVGVIEGHKYLDENGAAEGGRDAKTGLEGWTIKLYEDGDANGDGTANELVGTTTTAADGSYKFEELFYGNYKVTEELKSGWYNITDLTITTSLSSADKEETVDFYNTEKGGIGGKKVIDTDGDTHTTDDQSAGKGWTIELYKGDTKVGTTETGEDGSFAFSGLELGTYTVKEIAQDGFTNITSMEVTVDDLDSSGEIVGGVNFYNKPDAEEPENGMGNTPGFWKNHAAIFAQETDSSHSAKYESIFDVDVVGGKNHSADPTLLQALSAGGGGEAALLRASTAAWANATSDDVNYRIDEDANDLSGVINTLKMIDFDSDDFLSADEIINAVQDVYNVSGAETDFFQFKDAGLLASALDAMNNMPSVETADFFA